jgi:hypothetical protein
MKKGGAILAICTAIAFAAPVLASGSGGGGGGGYPSGPSFPNSGGASQSGDPYAATYGKGKNMFLKRITCKKCAYPGGVTDSKTAREVAKKVRAGEFDLKADQRQAVLFYMTERYSIRA